jgi:pilus assembly protein CpaC
VTVVFKEFGIRLNFQPLLTEHNTIKMFVRPEVSTIDMANAAVISGFTIPALSSRRMETHLELGVGQSFLIAGLLDERVTESLFRVPGLAHIPILGALFKSRAENKTRTELIVMVTPEITTPAAAAAIRKMPEMPKPFLAPLAPEKPAPGRTRPPQTAKPAGRGK